MWPMFSNSSAFQIYLFLVRVLEHEGVDLSRHRRHRLTRRKPMRYRDLHPAMCRRSQAGFCCLDPSSRCGAKCRLEQPSTQSSLYLAAAEVLRPTLDRS
jgi:hypothetical protein